MGNIETDDAYYLSKGICPHCGTREVEPGKSRCKECSDRNKVTSKKYYEKRKAKGICTRCGRKLREGDGVALCIKCIKTKRLYNRKRRLEFEAEILGKKVDELVLSPDRNGQFRRICCFVKVPMSKKLEDMGYGKVNDMRQYEIARFVNSDYARIFFDAYKKVYGEDA